MCLENRIYLLVLRGEWADRGVSYRLFGWQIRFSDIVRHSSVCFKVKRKIVIVEASVDRKLFCLICFGDYFYQASLSLSLWHLCFLIIVKLGNLDLLFSLSSFFLFCCFVWLEFLNSGAFFNFTRFDQQNRIFSWVKIFRLGLLEFWAFFPFFMVFFCYVDRIIRKRTEKENYSGCILLVLLWWRSLHSSIKWWLISVQHASMLYAFLGCFDMYSWSIFVILLLMESLNYNCCKVLWRNLVLIYIGRSVLQELMSLVVLLIFVILLQWGSCSLYSNSSKNWHFICWLAVKFIHVYMHSISR